MEKKQQLFKWIMYERDASSSADITVMPLENGIQIPYPMTALEGLIQAGKISGSILEDGEAEYCSWIAEKDWLFQTDFQLQETENCVLYFEGLDTDCEIWLNGEKIGESHSMYLPVKIPLSGKLKKDNELAVYFFSPIATMNRRAEEMPEAWKGIVTPSALLRKAPCDLYRNYLGVTPYFTPVGFFGEVSLLFLEKGTLEECRVDYDLNTLMTDAEVKCTTLIKAGKSENMKLRLSVFDPSSKETVALEKELTGKGWDEVISVDFSFVLREVRLWFPMRFGPQSMYEFRFQLLNDEQVRSEKVYHIGIRRIEKIGDLLFRVNGKVIRLWGANIATLGNVSHRADRKNIKYLLKKAFECNCNALRVWGPGDPVSDDFYNEADKMGFLVWQDFYLEPSQLPDTSEFRKLILLEAENLIKKIRHHASLLMWCGSNESFHMMDFNKEEARIGTAELLTKDLPQLCYQLDPQRYYHISCPFGGNFPNDPAVGDTHGSHCMMSFLPGEKYANFVSEHIVTFPPEMKSLTRFIPKEEIWPEGYSDLTSYGRDSEFPPALERRTNNYAQQKLGPIEQYYNATDAESLIYKYTAAAGYAYYHLITRLRRGKPFYDSTGSRRCAGYLSWKFNNTWPQFYCGLVDYYGETHIPYYETRRAFEPLLLNFEIDDHIYLWGVNDTDHDCQGILRVCLFRIPENRIVKEFTCPAAVQAGESQVLTNLDRLGHFRKDCVLYAELEYEGKTIAKTHELIDMERHLEFPQAVVAMRKEGDELVLTTDRYAHCVELDGITPDGNRFGWEFEDNYFDLLPFEEKRIHILGDHKKGTISAKAHYSDKVTRIDW